MSEVSFKLDGETVTLKPTFGAYTRIPKQFGGFMPAIDAVSKLNAEAIEVIVAHGMELTQHGQKGLGEKIFRTGVAVVAAPCIEYLTILMNGGKKPEESEGGDKSGEA